MAPHKDLAVLREKLEKDFQALEDTMKCLSMPRGIYTKSQPETNTQIMSMPQKSILPDVCPICNNVVQYYKLNYSEMIKMCSNMKCVYPFVEETLEIVPLISSHMSESSGISPGCSTQASLASDRRSIADSGLGSSIEITDFDKSDTFAHAEDDGEVANKEEEDRIESLIRKSSTLVAKLNKCRPKRQQLSNPAYIKQLLNIQRSMNMKKSLIKPKEMEILNDSERRKNNFKVNIKIPEENDSITKIDISFG